MNQTLLTVKVAKKTLEADATFSFELIDATNMPLPAFDAGAHIDVHLADGLIRQYSLCNDARETNRYRIAVLRDANSRGGSAAMHDQVQEGQLIQISAPRNHFALDPSAQRSLLLAGGIGVTPILAMAQSLSQQGADFKMAYCARSRSRAAFHDEIRESAFAERVVIHFDDGEEKQRFDIGAALDEAGSEAHLYVCGPQGFIDAVVATAKERGWNDTRIHFEYFGAAPVQADDDGSFEVQIASSGKVYSVAKDKTVVAALAEHGIKIPVSCEQGVCGTCITRICSGIPDHRDYYMTDAEHDANDQFTPCCSRAKTPRLVLDL